MAAKKLSVKELAKKITGFGLEVVKTETGDFYLVSKGEGGAGPVMQPLDSGTAAASVFHRLVDRNLEVTTFQVKEALTFLRASPDIRVTPLFCRVADHGARLYLDLADKQRRVVEIQPGSWSVTTKYEPLFHRSATTSALPVPIRGGTLSRLRDLLDLAGDQWWLFLGAVLAAFNQRGPHFLTVIQGPSGAGKTVLAQCIETLVDPRNPPLNLLPTQLEGALITGHNRWVISYDNLNPLTPKQSATLSAMVTGVGMENRTLYTNKEVAAISICAPVIITGICGLLDREEIRTRALPLLLEHRETTRCNQEFLGALQRELPAILGAILDCVANGLANPIVGQVWHTRTCTAEAWVEACFRGSDLGENVFTAALARARKQVLGQAAKEWPLFDFLRGLAEKTSVLLTKDMYAKMEKHFEGRPRPVGVPSSAESLGKQLKANTNTLAAAGIQAESKQTSAGTKWRILLSTPATAA